MKKKITLMILIIALSGFGVYAQPLENTTWKVYDPSRTFFTYFHFSTDTVSISNDNITYTNVGTGQISGNNMTCVDLPGGQCPETDTGRYTFLIQNDTLRFTLVNDQCSSRATTMTTFHFIRFLTGIQSKNVFPVIKVYPNPANEVIFIKSNNNIQGSTYFITDQLSRQILTGKLISETTSVDIKQLPKGIYFFHIAGEKSMNIKVMKK